jgi:hypothetical protein
MSTLTRLKEKIRSRSQHWYGLDLMVKSKDLELTLCLRHPKTGETATETVTIDPTDLEEVYGDEQTLMEYADRIIERFVYPVKALQTLD